MTSDAVAADSVDALNGLLRGELSAVETYDQSFDRFADRPELADRLRAVRDEHQDAVRTLRELVTDLGGAPAEGSGPWGSFVAAVTGTARVIGPGTLLAALRQGEEIGIEEYRRALATDLPAAGRDVVMVVVGDHQPPALVSGEGASWNVPVHVIASRAAVLDRLRGHGFRDGLPPGGPVLARMDTLMPILLDAFGDSE